MNTIDYRGGSLHMERVDLEALAQRFGTPCYVYSRADIESNWRAFDRAFGAQPHLVCFAAKANANLGVLDILARLGSGFDIVSGGELERVLAAGGRADKTVFAGVGKSVEEMRAALAAGVKSFNVESASELEQLNAVAGAMGCEAPVSLRVNPDIDAQTHPYISTGLKENKFGVAIEEAPALYARAVSLPHVNVYGIDCHVGSQIVSIEPLTQAMERVLELVDALRERGVSLHHVNLGGGMGIRYSEERPPGAADLVHALLARVGERPLELLIEPGRAIVGNAGVLLTRVRYIKRNGERNFAIVDAAMNDLIRPALYQAWQAVQSVREALPSGALATYEIVGPVCESADFLAHSRELSLEEGALLAVRSAGAYSFVMSSNYNSRPRAPEVVVDGAEAHLVRKRESTSALFELESRLP
ncbi:MAG: diaminopimelate decarboxylase [Gammaproteobacteria bacterium]